MEDFFNLLPFEDDQVRIGKQLITRAGIDQYEIEVNGAVTLVDLTEDAELAPPYQVTPDYVPGGLTKMGIEVLGGASGFTPSEPCTGLALCYNGEYILIDCIPFLERERRFVADCVVEPTAALDTVPGRSGLP